MKNINSLLARFSNLLDKKTVVKETVSLVISKNIGKKIPIESIFIEGEVLEVHTSPAAKNELRIKEQKILSELKKEHKIYISRVLYK